MIPTGSLEDLTTQAKIKQICSVEGPEAADSARAQKRARKAEPKQVERGVGTGGTRQLGWGYMHGSYKCVKVECTSPESVSFRLTNLYMGVVLKPV